ncbi:class I SAM-dependent methyltransferase [Glutamicibacter sp.]|uniref:class I SAM-dependent methyltransferase n=1 Tax=Glutamicibacter sp. TaxID=1931995 RepID=UPI0028BEFF1D|nr:class I SAM-dependent methyltransferase [Glutamicibacter sp.]
MSHIGYDPRIVDLYDEDNPDGPDHDYYRGLATATGARQILDLGCGTGILTVTFAEPGRCVVGVDPSATMLDFAAHRAGADAVRWILGNSGSIPQGRYDLMVMSGNVAQHIPEGQWVRSLKDLRRVAAPDALLAFESRNPQDRAWERWAGELKKIRNTQYGEIEEWCEVEELGEGQVRLRVKNQFLKTGEVVVQESVLSFRGERQVIADLREAGFEVLNVWGDWDQSDFDGSQRIMIFEARPAADDN